jgi:hypothetical protein
VQGLPGRIINCDTYYRRAGRDHNAKFDQFQTEAAKAELSTVQLAMDTVMAKGALTSDTAVTTVTSYMTTFPDAVHPLSSSYLRSAFTMGTYTCRSSGAVSQVSTGYLNIHFTAQLWFEFAVQSAL